MGKEVSIGIRVSEQEKDALKKLAEKRDVPMSQIVRTAIKRELEEALQNER